MAYRTLSVAIALLTLFHSSSPALALTAKDVLDKMGKKESGAYIAASIEMAAYLAYVDGDKARSACIVKWYETPGTTAKVVKVFGRFLDHTPQAILYVLMNRQCGKPKTAAK